MGRRPGRRGIKKGGIRDPVAQSIRNEQNRDAAPNPEEAEEMKRKHLASEGCRECGEDDPDELDYHAPRTHDCPARQKRYEPVVLCDDCAEDRLPFREFVVERAREQGSDVVVFYECDATQWRSFSRPVIEGQKGETFEDTRVEPNAEVELKCKCGAGIDDIEYLDA